MRLTADLLLHCYRNGVFPMAEARDDPELFLVDPQERGVIPLDERFHIPKRLLRVMRGSGLVIRVDSVFTDVISACAAPQPERTDTWINPDIERLYSELHERGFAHSVEVWDGADLVGGLYGVALGGAFFGESMFSRASNTSKIALVALVNRLRVCGFQLLDAQFWTPHLAQFGASVVSKREFRKRLSAALAATAEFTAAPAEQPVAQLVQEITQTS